MSEAIGAEERVELLLEGNGDLFIEFSEDGAVELSEVFSLEVDFDAVAGEKGDRGGGER